MSSDLTHAIKINVEIQHVIDASRQVNYVALNALLTSRKAGADSRGFAVVARQLRTLSGELEQSMSQLDEVIGRLVTGIASLIREGRKLGYVHAADAACDTPPACMKGMLVNLRQRVGVWQGRVDADWTKLTQYFARAMRLAEMGGILSRNAKIEAAHGGEMAGQLFQVAEQMEHDVSQVVVRLRTLHALIKT